MDIEVTCSAADSLPIDTLVDFQGSMKSISNDNLEKLKRRIVKHGVNVPVFVWENEGDYYILDGHQRIKALNALREDGYNLPLIPVAYIQADNEQDAKDKLLGITSQYGEFDTEGFFEFTSDIEIEDVRFTNDKIDFESTFDVPEDNKEIDEDELSQTENECPRCGFRW